ncbi:hypothetical protein HY627_00375 [Candidatus Uhrbacteria bacterium]|nr:hypothetical protein [Candidatus Uhrbacteria bacterium]
MRKQSHRRARQVIGVIALSAAYVFCALPLDTYAASKIKTAQRLTIAKIRTLQKGQLVETEGGVTSLPGILGKGIFYIQDETAGMQVLLVKGDAPVLKEGDRVRIRGKTSLAGEEIHIRVASAADVRRIKEEKPIEPKEVVLSEIEKFAGSLVQTTGEVAEKRGQTIILKNESAKLRVLLKRSAPFSKNTAVKGQQMTLSGIVMNTPDGYRLLPRSDSDIVPENMPLREERPRSPTGKMQKADRPFAETIVSILLALAGIAGGFLMQKQNGKKES